MKKHLIIGNPINILFRLKYTIIGLRKKIEQFMKKSLPIKKKKKLSKIKKKTFCNERYGSFKQMVIPFIEDLSISKETNSVIQFVKNGKFMVIILTVLVLN